MQAYNGEHGVRHPVGWDFQKLNRSIITIETDPEKKKEIRFHSINYQTEQFSEK